VKLVLVAALSLLLAAPVFAQTPTSAADPGPPLSGYPRKALGLPTPAELTTATYVRDVTRSPCGHEHDDHRLRDPSQEIGLQTKPA
jgi:hypothetical protein